MDTGETFAIVAGTGVGLGLMLLLFGMWGSHGESVPTAAKPLSDSVYQRFLNFLAPAAGRYATQTRQALAIGVPIVGLGVALATKIPVFGLTAAFFTLLMPALVLPDSTRKDKLLQLRALDAWIRGISARMRSGISLDQALSVSARDVATIGPQLQRMTAAIAAGVPSAIALRAFADDIADGTYDFAVQKLILVSGRSVEGLAEALESLAAAVTKRVEARQNIEVDRAKPQSTSRIVVIIGLGMIGGFPLLEHDFMTPYRTLSGQIIFAVFMVLGAMCLLWAKSIARMEPEPRIFGAEASKSPADEVATELFGLGGKQR